MRLFYTLILVFLGQTVLAQDTISVQTFTYDSISTRRAVFDFPASLQGETFEKVLMYYNLKCSPLTPWDSYNCGEWDYLTNTTIFDHTGVYDSVLKEGPQFLVNNVFLNNFSYSNTPYYHFYENYQYFINNTTISENDYAIGTGTDPANFPFGSGNNLQHTQILWTAAELSTAGVVAGDINKLRFDIATDGDALGHLTIQMKHSNESSLSDFDHNGWTVVYDFNSDFLSTGQQTLDLVTPFNYNGTDGILIDISFENGSAGTDNIVNATPTTNQSVISTSERLGYLNVSPGEHVEVDLDNYNFQDEVTISFWSSGDVAYLPANTSIMEGRDSLNNRIVNIHFPWNNSRFYWDAGTGSGYDRIDKAASVSEIEGQWNHWAFTKNKVTGEMKIYKNGTQWHSGTGKNRDVGIVNKFRIGKSESGNFSYGGKIDEFRVWDTELDAATISGWMNQKVDNSHPNYSDLVLYYDFDSDQAVIDRSTNGKDGMMTTTGMIQFQEDAPVAYETFNTRPNITFVQGTYTSVIDSVLVTDSVLVDPIDVLEYAVDGRKFVINQISHVYPVGYSYTYDYMGNKTDSTMINADVNIVNDSISYYEAPFEIVNPLEIGRFITPYGIGFDLGPNGFTWVYDVTDYQSLLLTDLVDLRAHNTQELIDVRFDFITGTPPRDILKIEKLWDNYGNHKYGDIDNDVDLSAIDVDLDAAASGYKVKTRITGHGHEGNGNCCEWQDKSFSIAVDGTTQYNWSIWQPTECGDNPNIGQGGTWPYAREGWCPGDKVKDYDFELTPHVTPGATVTLDYDIQNVPSSDAGQANGNYRISTHLASYGAPNFTLDAAVIDVLNPNDWEYYGKWNPSCQNPRIIIKNTGSTPLTSAKITIWVGDHGWQDTHYEWTGNLEFLEEETVEIPIENWFWKEEGNGELEFHASISEPNGGVDQYANNDQYNVKFEPTYSINQPFYIWFQTNNKANENSIYLKDEDGNTIWSRTSLSNNTEYKDTFDLAAGCYSVELYDSDHDGIGFWYSSQVEGETNGTLRLRKVGGSVFHTFNRDFGRYTKYNFSIGFGVGLEENTNNYNFDVYPNPTSGEFIVSLDNFVGETIEINVFNSSGQLIRTISKYQENVEGLYNFSIDLSDETKGIYFVSVTSNNQQQTKRITVQ